MKRLWILVMLFCGALGTISAQRTVSGTITDEAGEPLIGASVEVKDAGVGTTTDIDGNYSLEVPDGYNTLVFTYVGFTEKEMELGASNVLNVTMAEGLLLDELVVTGLGIERERKAVGYAVTELSSDVIEQVSETDPVRALQGKVAGLSVVGAGGAVASGTNVTLRGNSSLLGNNQALFVVDGIPFDNTSFETAGFTSATTSTSRSFDLDPYSIEDITILRGAAAAALYGTRAANGVILITTKAAAAKNSDGLEVTFNSSYNIEQISNLPDYQTRYANGNNFQLVNGNFGTWGASFDINEPEWQNASNFGQITNADGSPYFDANGNAINPGAQPYMLHPYNNTAEGRSILSETYVPFRPTNNADDFFQDGFALENAITLRGGNEQANFFGTFSRLDNEGIVPNNMVDKTTLGVGGNIKPAKGLSLRGAVNYVRVDLTSPPSAGLFTGGTSVTERIIYLPPSLDLKNSPIELPNGDQVFYRTDNDNPYYLAEYAQNKSVTDRVYGNLALSYDLTDWLTAEYRAGMNTYRISNLQVEPISTRGQPLGQLWDDEVRYEELDGNFSLRAERDLTSKVGLTAIVGHNINTRTIDRQAYNGVQMIVRGINDLDNTSNVVPFGGGLSERRYHAVYADLGFDYDNWLYVNFTGRNEWNSGLPADDRSDAFGSVSASFVLTDALDVNVKNLDFAKLRVSYASVGNDINPYQTQNVFIANPALGNNIASFNYPYSTFNGVSRGSVLANPNLLPERTNEFEVGLELAMFNNRLRLNTSYYDRLSKDNILPAEVPTSTGYSSRIVNVGEISNEGIEVELGFTPVRAKTKKGINWSNTVVFTRNVNLVEELGDTEQLFIAGFGNSIRSVHREGEEFGQIFGSVAARHTDGQLLVDPSTGKLIEALDFEVIANPNPDFFLSFGTEVAWNNFTLGGLFEWAYGGELWSATFNQAFGRGVVEQTIPDHPNGRAVTLVIPGVEGDPTTQTAVLDENGDPIPNGVQLTTNDWWFINTFGSAGPDEFSVFDRSSLRLRELSLGYTFPQELIGNTFLKSLNISVTARNLWFLAYNMPNSLNFDPETTSLGAGNVNSLGGSGATNGSAQGIDFGIIPTTRRFGVNLSARF